MPYTVTLDANEATQTPVLEEVIVEQEPVDECVVDPLPVGDIAVGGCLFERKTVSDFADSVRDGRLTDQLDRLDTADASTYILIEGDMRDFEHLYSNIGAPSLRGMVASITVRADTPVLFCSNMQTLVDALLRLARKADSAVETVQTGQAHTAQDSDFMTNLFLGIDGIGAELAERLADEFDSIPTLATATRSDFEAIDGIGPTKADDIVDATG